MANLLSKWIHKKRVERKGRPPLPVLPSERPRHLTPTSSNETLSGAAATATANSSLFQRLPFELRRMILANAFGGQVVHMDLFYDHPPLPGGETSPKGGEAHCSLNVNWDDYNGAKPLNLDSSLPKQWLWRSSICHRELPYQHLPPQHQQSLAQDKCRYGRTEWSLCSHWPGEMPGKCFLGVMGWLLTCRQAYAEGIDVLYSTNTFHSASREMLIALPRVLLPQRLSSIKAVEFLWEFEDRPSHEPAPTLHPTSGMKSFLSFLDTVPTIFPQATSLYLSVQGGIHDNTPREKPSDWEKGTCDVLLAPVDDMVRRLGAQVRECTMAVPSSLFLDRRERAKQTGAVVQHVYQGELERYWRSVDKANLAGYWVALGEKDMRFPYGCMMGGTAGIMPDDEWVLYG